MAGGYTVLRSTLDALSFANDHFPTLDLARRYGLPALMFPVSIGPLPLAVRRTLLETYRAYSTVFVRDDETADELASLPNTVRVPDLAVQAIAEQETTRVTANPSEKVCLIARGIDRQDDGYAGRLRDLDAGLRRSFEITWRLQVPRDAEFYRGAGLPFSPAPLKYEGLKEEVCATVSVRLHGALMSILNGVPAIHISYDRKGLGAYGDLGLEDWLHTADAFDPDLVADQVRALVANPTNFWRAIDRSRPRLLKMIRAQTDRVADFWPSIRQGQFCYQGAGDLPEAHRSH